jgi:hypothetical protein
VQRRSGTAALIVLQVPLAIGERQSPQVNAVEPNHIEGHIGGFNRKLTAAKPAAVVGKPAAKPGRKPAHQEVAGARPGGTSLHVKPKPAF